MGIGKSLKKFVKKAAPVVGAVAPFFLGPAAGAFVGAATGAIGGGGLKGALMGGLGGYAAGNFGKGFGAGFAGAGGAAPGSLMGSGMAGQGTSFLSKLGSGLRGGIGSLAKGFGMGPQGGIMNAITGGGSAPMGTMPTSPVSGAWGPQEQFRSKGFLGPSTGVGPWSDIAQTAMSGVPHSGAVTGEDAEGVNQIAGDIASQYAAGQQGGGTWGGLVEFAKNAFNEKNLPLTAGLLGGLAQMWENKTGEKPGQVAWG